MLAVGCQLAVLAVLAELPVLAVRCQRQRRIGRVVIDGAVAAVSDRVVAKYNVYNRSNINSDDIIIITTLWNHRPHIKNYITLL